MKNLVVRVVRGRTGIPQLGDFQLVEEPVPVPAPGEVLYRAIYMSLDAGIRTRMPAPDGSARREGGLRAGDRMIAGRNPPLNGWTGNVVGQVLESRHPGFAAGDFVHGGIYWQTHHVLDGRYLAKVDPGEAPLVSEVGELAQSSFTAWCGMELVARVKPGEIVLVSAAGGAVGMVAGQLARIAGARVVGVASGEKCSFVTEELGFDACVDRRGAGPGRAGLDAAVTAACPDGIDVYFDNVGGTVREVALDKLRRFGRLVVCGYASEYGTDAPGTIAVPPILMKSLTVAGFVVWDHYDLFHRFRADMLGWIRSGQIRYRRTLVRGLESAPQAFIDLLEGRNTGKPIVQVGEDPTAAAPGPAS